ncbi:MAG TPA: M23 family metallopeptidase [Stellaceae bacterium]|nr:M23 family metallopeptidase [Stellaceae bacterium]
MTKATRLRRRAGEVAAIIIAVGLLAACSGGPPAPVLVGDATVPPGGPAMMMPPAPMPPPSAPRVPPRLAAAAPLAASRPEPPRPEPPPREGVRIVVQRGQSVGGLAERYHVSPHDIIAANHLKPPYGVEIGQPLFIPGAAERPVQRMAADATAMPRLQQRDRDRPMPDIIPLDGPAPTEPERDTTARPPGAAMPRIALDAAAPRREPAEAAATAAHRGDLLWPVEGRIVEGYGASAGGRPNAGINIAAPRGTPVRAVAGGVVAYAGNQLRGYGNLVLIKHPDGLISAYAHCEELLVHRGEQVAQGQVIAKVGETGGVGRPQLHFELREGDRAVDPRQFLEPAQG